MTTANNKITPRTGTSLGTTQGSGSTIMSILKSEKMKDQFRMALPKHIDTERFTRIALTCIRQNPKLIECSQESLLGALMTSAQLGLEPGVLGQAYLIPYKGECQFQLSYKGMRDLLERTGKVKTFYCETIHENDDFDYTLGTAPDLKHKPTLFNRGEVIGYYAVCILENGQNLFKVMSKDDVVKHEEKTRQGSYKNNVWNKYFDEMAHKTVAKKLMKWLPVSVEVVEQVETSDGKFKEYAKGELKEVAPAVESLPETDNDGVIVEDKFYDVAEIFDGAIL